MELTEKGAATAYAKMWNRLDCSGFLPLLADDCRYSSQWVVQDMEDKDTISDYLTVKMQTVKDTGATVRVELGVVRVGPYPDRDCAFLAQRQDINIQAVVVFGVADDKIESIDLCGPEMYPSQRTGVYPI